MVEGAAVVATEAAVVATGAEVVAEVEAAVVAAVPLLLLPHAPATSARAASGREKAFVRCR